MKIEQTCDKNTQNFLKSYRIQKAMSSVSGFDETLPQATTDGVASAAIKPFDLELQSGQIRLLADLERLTYVLLLKRWGDDAFLVTAFSHYDFPATDEEMSLERYAGAYLNVLQIWNTRTLRDETLRRSWCCGTLPEELRRDAEEFWQSLQSDRVLSDRLRAKSGTPIDDGDKLRRQYMLEERGIFAGLDMPNWFNSELMLPALWTNTAALAAGDAKKTIRKKCAIDGYSEKLILTYSAAENTVWIDIFSADLSARAATLDGSEIVDVQENVLGVLANGACRFAVGSDFDGSIGLRMPDGSICILTEIS